MSALLSYRADAARFGLEPRIPRGPVNGPPA